MKSSWRDIPKIDAHVHILPQEIHDANPDAEDEFSYAVASDYAAIMARYNIQRAVIMPFNDPCLMSMAFTAEAVHHNLKTMCEDYNGRFFCFADTDVRNSPEESVKQIRRALGSPAFRGIKLHPNNSGMCIDDAYNDAIAACALAMDCPIAVHSYPSGAKEQDRLDPCSPARIVRWMNRHPGLKVIVCHLGGFQWEDAVNLDAFFDISAILSDYADRFGIQKTNEILRAFGPEKLLFATDWPCSRSVAPDDIVMQYLAILDQMDFSTEEMHQIAH